MNIENPMHLADPPEPEHDTDGWQERISRIESHACELERPYETVVDALCEIARQVARLADLREYELGLELQDDEEEDDEPEEHNEFSKKVKGSGNAK